MEFQEAPMLAELVAAGTLPPVEERLPAPSDVYVVEPVDAIGKYGGVARTASSVPTHAGGDTQLQSFPNFVKGNPELNAIVPHILKDLTHSEDTRQWTLHLRQGMRWSDGHPFTADDIEFWYFDVLLNEDLTPVVGVNWRDRLTNAVATFERVDDYAVTFGFDSPTPFFAETLVHFQDIVAKHYLSQFHPSYTDPDVLDQLVADAGFDTWYQLFAYQNSAIWGIPLHVDRPTLSGYRLTQITSDRRVYERNPYYWKVDTAGNQLPYFDGIDAQIVADREVIQGMIMSGQLDYASRNTDIQNFPLYRQFEEDGNYRTILWDTTYGSQIVFKPNMTHREPAMREILGDARFRQALSLAIDRDEISQMLFFGQAVPRQFTVLDTSRYFEPEFADAFVEYDPEAAMALLDEIGMDIDSEGYRTRLDGERMVIEIEFVDQIVPRSAMTELVVEYWREIGLDVRSRAISGELSTERSTANLMDMNNWVGDKTTDVLFPVEAFEFVPIRTSWDRTQWPLWEQWFASAGAAGEEPPENIKEIHNWWSRLMVEADEERRVELAKNILQAQADNLWVIGTVGSVPHPIIVNKDIRNYPENGLWGWDTGVFNMNRNPEQLFFDR